MSKLHGSSINNLNASYRLRPENRPSDYLNEVGDLVYVKNDMFKWLPAKVVERDEKAAVGPTVTVELMLPPNWKENTVGAEESPLQSGENRVVFLEDYEGAHLPYQNVDKNGEMITEEDMTNLPHLHPSNILYNFRERGTFDTQEVYARVGEMIVAMNPFEWIMKHYSKERRRFYAKEIIWKKPPTAPDSNSKSIRASLTSGSSLKSERNYPPHAYEISAICYRALLEEDVDQAILVSGESGSGKTETLKILMAHLATIQPPAEDENVEVKERGLKTMARVLQSNPIFESFGNSKTDRNDNSSRFGRCTKFQFRTVKADDKDIIDYCELVGSVTQTYLLEKSRVVTHDSLESTFHIFYQLLSADKDVKEAIWDGLSNRTYADFPILSREDNDEDSRIENDKKMFNSTITGLNSFGFKDDKLRTLMRTLCVVLQLSRIKFVERLDEESQDMVAAVENQEEMNQLKDLLGIDMTDLLTTRVMVTPWAKDGKFTIRLSATAAAETRDALAKGIYVKVIFEYLLRVMNNWTGYKEEENEIPKIKTITLLDIFGFESFKINRFEQLCINFCSERLQQKYIQDSFGKMENEYLSEGILDGNEGEGLLFDLSVVDNAPSLDLIGGRFGLLDALNEESIRPNSTDASYVFKIKTVHKKNHYLLDLPLQNEYTFAVRHYNGTVEYDARGFLRKNTDTLPLDIVERLAKDATNSLVKKEFGFFLEDSKKIEQDATKLNKRNVNYRKKHQNTVLYKFRRNLRELMASIEDTQVKFIRCIRPNDMLKPRLVDHELTLNQLESAGLVTHLRMIREGFPNSMLYEKFLKRFHMLMPGLNLAVPGNSESAIKERVEILLNETLPSDTTYASGRTKIFFRQDALEAMELRRTMYYGEYAMILQLWARGVRERKKFLKQRRVALWVQSIYRSRKSRFSFQAHKDAAVRLQATYRGFVGRNTTRDRRRTRASFTIQRAFRKNNKFSQIGKFREACLIIQHAVRAKANNRKMKNSMVYIVEQARQERMFLMWKQDYLRWRECNPPSKQNMDNSMIHEGEQIMNFFHLETHSLRREMADLQAILRRNKEELQKQSHHAHVAAASKLQISNLTADVASLKKEISTYHQEQRQLKMKNAQTLTDMAVQRQEDIDQHNREIEDLKHQIATITRQYETEVRTKNNLLLDAERKHEQVQLELNEQLKKTQEGHGEYLAKLMDVLDNTNAAREAKMQQMKYDYETKLKDKDERYKRLHDSMVLESATQKDRGRLKGISFGFVPQSSVM